MSELFGNTHLELLDRQITSWLMTMMERNETIVAVDRGEPDDHPRRGRTSDRLAKGNIGPRT